MAAEAPLRDHERTALAMHVAARPDGRGQLEARRGDYCRQLSGVVALQVDRDPGGAPAVALDPGDLESQRGIACRLAARQDREQQRRPQPASRRARTWQAAQIALRGGFPSQYSQRGSRRRLGETRG
jgi:hypothetical protein